MSSKRRITALTVIAPGQPAQFELNHAAIHDACSGTCAVCDKVRGYREAQGQEVHRG